MSVLRFRFWAVTALMSFFVLPAMAQTAAGEGKGGSYHYSGGPKSEVPYHPGEKATVGQKKAGSGGSHHYFGGPKSEVPHHIGPKKD